MSARERMEEYGELALNSEDPEEARYYLRQALQLAVAMEAGQ